MYRLLRIRHPGRGSARLSRPPTPCASREEQAEQGRAGSVSHQWRLARNTKAPTGTAARRASTTSGIVSPRSSNAMPRGRAITAAMPPPNQSRTHQVSSSETPVLSSIQPTKNALTSHETARTPSSAGRWRACSRTSGCSHQGSSGSLSALVRRASDMTDPDGDWALVVGYARASLANTPKAW